jgi:hypothetical protein
LFIMHEQLTHPADLRTRRERARALRARAVHVIFQNSKFQILAYPPCTVYVSSCGRDT